MQYQKAHKQPHYEIVELRWESFECSMKAMQCLTQAVTEAPPKRGGGVDRDLWVDLIQPHSSLGRAEVHKFWYSC